MQPTSLNKVVSLFLSGGLLVLGIAIVLLMNGAAIVLPQDIDKLAQAGGEGFFAVVGALLLLPLAALAGAVCEGLTDISVRRFIKWACARRLWIKLLCQEKIKVNHDSWLAEFQAVARSSELFEGFPAEKHDHGAAVGLLYDSGKEETINWVESHYSTYILASNFAFLALIGELCLVWCKWGGAISWSDFLVGSFVAVLAFYSCLSLSVDRFIYSYQVILRQAVILLLRQKVMSAEEKVEAAPAHNPSAPPDVNRAARGRRR